MTKDRLQELQANAEKYEDNDDFHRTIHFVVIDMEGPFMADFFSQINSFHTAVDKLHEFIRDVRRLHNAMLAPQPDNKTKQKLQETMIDIKKLGNDIRTKLKKMKPAQEMENVSENKTVQQRIKAAQISLITKRFCEAMNEYTEAEVIHRERCEKRIARQLEIAGFERNDDVIEALLENGNSFMFPEILFETQQAERSLSDIEARHQDIVQIEKSLRELHALFADLAFLVDSQGTMINSIEEHVKYSQDYVESTIPSLTPYKSWWSVMKGKIYCVVVFIIILVLLFMYLALRSK